jgi:hypothetical protein
MEGSERSFTSRLCQTCSWNSSRSSGPETRGVERKHPRRICRYQGVSIIDLQDDPEKQKEIDTAFEHFALLVIKTEGAEYLELKPQPNTRTQWVRDGENWKETKVCP